jgi:glucan phosphoethanolaminetransferase (alkaline phosphatase superfamily)
LLLAIYTVTGLLGVVALLTNDMGQAIIGLIVMLVTLAIWVIGLVLMNIYMRVVFEVVLLMFNMYDSLKAVEDNTKGKK